MISIIMFVCYVSSSDVPLSHYEYVQECRKFDRDVKLVMLLEEEVDHHLARTVSTITF